MADPEHVEVVKQGAEAIRAWRSKHRGVTLDLDGAGLVGADLSGAHLSGAVLTGAVLTRAELGWARLAGADLRGAFLRGARLSGADLAGADLTRAHLGWADLSGAGLHGADLTASICRGTNFGNVDLSEAKGLEAVRHEGPSTVGVDTLFKSRGQVPAAFLRGCGVPEWLISNLPTFTASQEPIQYYSCFISYSSRDEDFARKLHARMRDERLRVWFAPEDIQGGKKLYEQISTQIRSCDKLLVILSQNSMASQWVKTEILKAWQRQEDGQRVLFPIRLVPFEAIRGWEFFNSDEGRDLAREVREYFIPDFSGWRDEAGFEQAFARLLRDLRADANTHDKEGGE